MIFYLRLYSYCDGVDWGNQQLEYLLKISGSLDLQMLLRIYDYLASIEIKEESVCAQRVRLSMLIRKRLDKEIEGVRTVRMRIKELAKRVRSLVVIKH